MTLIAERAPGTSERDNRSGPGRPRVSGLDAAILTAAVELIDAGEEVTVSRIVAASGASRAALYRRWPSITQLIAAALDVGRTEYPAIAATDDLREAVVRNFIPDMSTIEYPEARFRQRLKLIMADRELQRAYWESHVERRRRPLEASLRAAIADGRLRADLDVPSCIDTLAGIAYYQLIVRGADLSEPDTRARMLRALDTVWNGMVAHAHG